MLVGKKLQSNAGFWLLKIFEHCNYRVQRVLKRYKNDGAACVISHKPCHSLPLVSSKTAFYIFFGTRMTVLTENLPVTMVSLFRYGEMLTMIVSKQS